MLVSVLTHDSFSSEFDKWYKLFFYSFILPIFMEWPNHGGIVEFIFPIILLNILLVRTIKLKL
ncbi:hypothetical protein DNK63_13680 [Providencia rettgeri]|nr:hypothetical protein DNK63_13680 [Providencia rettgeri]